MLQSLHQGAPRKSDKHPSFVISWQGIHRGLFLLTMLPAEVKKKENTKHINKDKLLSIVQILSYFQQSPMWSKTVPTPYP